jgi:hypothetical protein
MYNLYCRNNSREFSQVAIYTIRVLISLRQPNIYRISRPTRHTFFPKKCYLNLTCALCAEGKHYSKLINTHTSIIQHLYRDYDFSGIEDDFLGFYDE